MKRKYKNFKSFIKNTRNLTLYHIRNKRAYFDTGKKQGWNKFEMELPQKYWEQILDIIGGAHKNRKRIENIIKDKRFQHWAFERFIYSGTRDKFEYIAGQDYTYEINSIRKDILK